MKIVVVQDAVAVGEVAAAQIAGGIERGEISVLGVATGSSPTPVYRGLRALRTPAFARLTAFALDEYVGLPLEHPESYHSVIHREVTVPLGLDPARVHVPDGSAIDLPAACLAYEAAIREAGGIDLQILGIGSDGHIGFNEPTSSLSSRTRVKTLTPSTREDNARFFDSIEQVPVHCVTQGLGTILEARQVLLVAHGEAKAAAVAAAIEGPVSAMCPATVLQFHQRATFVIDRAAASRLTHLDYYEYVQAKLPSWQRP